jgi:pyruvate formate-lyase/glycerol dehydratase family glycyl radical enzyme
METMERKALSEKVSKYKEEFFAAKPTIDTQRIEFMLEVYKETAMDPAVMSRAKLFQKLCSEKTIYIDGNPLVGSLTQYKYGAYPVPEEGCGWMQRVNEFALQRGKAKITSETRVWLDKAVELWRDTNIFARTRKVVLDVYNVDLRDMTKCGVWLEATPGGATHVRVPDYEKVLNQGLKGVLAEVEEAEAHQNPGAPDGMSKWYFYKATKMVLNGMITLANRYADLAKEMAVQEKDGERKRELEKIAEVCQQIPANPARNFREALQAFWFTMLGVWMEGPNVLSGPPVTFTKCLYPFYKKDKAAGIITDEEVIELIQFFFLKVNQLAHVLTPHGFRFSQTRLGQQLGLGGLNRDGESDYNELELLVLEAQYRLRVPEPLINVVYSDKLPENFLLKCVDLVRTGIGQPAFHNSQVAIERHLLHHHMPLEDARTLAIAGCVQSFIPGSMDGYWETRFNVAKMVEFALENGKDPLTGLQLGPQTGNANDFNTFEEFYQAFSQQLDHLIRLTHNASKTAWSIQRIVPCPFSSSLINDCIKQGKDMVDGGARYSFADGVCMVGGIDAANSLAAVKHLVFEEKTVTMPQLREALAANFEGYESLKEMCLNAPKYGNDDNYGDAIAQDIYERCYMAHEKTDHLGKPVAPSAYSVASHAAFGSFTGALPNGRVAKVPLTDASVSAQRGTDKNGVTALVKSAARVLDTVKYGSNHLNIKFHPTALKGLNGARKLISLMKTYFDLGGYHVQFNCITNETLKQAMLHPEDYKELIVRVAGFSAYFVNLDKDVQEEIIERTEHAL